LRRRFPLDDPVSCSVSSPEMSEAEQVKATWPWRSGVSVVAPWPERHQLCFVRVYRQAVLLHAPGKHVHHAPCIVFSLKANNKVVRIADEEGAPSQARFHIPFEPLVEHLVQEDVCQQR